MFTRPDGLADAAVSDAVARGWGLTVTGLTHAPVGFGSHHWIADTTDGRRFVTVDDLEQRGRDRAESRARSHARLDAALGAASALFEAGTTFVVAPLLGNNGRVTRPIDDRWVVAIYLFVASTGADVADGSAWHVEIVGRLATLHGAAPPACLEPDDLALPARDELEIAMAVPLEGEPGPFTRPAADLLARHHDAVVAALAEYDRLTDIVRSRPERRVVTHGEPHRRNTLDTADGLVMIDWDTALLAPPERDLWALADDHPSVLAEYELRAGSSLDPDALALYRLWWDLCEIALYTADFRRPHGYDDDTAIAWSSLQRHLDPARWTFLDRGGEVR